MMIRRWFTVLCAWLLLKERTIPMSKDGIGHSRGKFWTAVIEVFFSPEMMAPVKACIGEGILFEFRHVLSVDKLLGRIGLVDPVCVLDGVLFPSFAVSLGHNGKQLDSVGIGQ